MRVLIHWVISLFGLVLRSAESLSEITVTHRPQGAIIVGNNNNNNNQYIYKQRQSHAMSQQRWLATAVIFRPSDMSLGFAET